MEWETPNYNLAEYDRWCPYCGQVWPDEHNLTFKFDGLRIIKMCRICAKDYDETVEKLNHIEW